MKIIGRDATDRDGDACAENAMALEMELAWLEQVIELRLRQRFGDTAEDTPVEPLLVAPPALEGDSPYVAFVRDHALGVPTRLIVALALAPHVRPELLDALWLRNEATGRGFTELGGVQGIGHGGLMPTGETAAFLIGGGDLQARFELTRLLSRDAFLARNDIVTLAPPAPHEPTLSGVLAMARERVALFTTGERDKPAFGSDFPARRVQTELGFSDLVLPQATLEELDEIRSWVVHRTTLLRDWGMHARIRPGFISLFHGPPGTGKTLAASMLGKHCGCDVYKIDLSMIVSKYIGETEKNLAKVFDLAAQKGWILFFDEADALFGKRTRVDDAHDRFANQEVSFLLQRIEEHDGVVILASNLKANMDPAFLRRFNSVIAFPMPSASERLRLWRDALPAAARLEDGVELARLAERYEISGGTISNVLRYAALRAVDAGTDVLLLEHIEAGIKRELLKEGRVL